MNCHFFYFQSLHLVACKTFSSFHFETLNVKTLELLTEVNLIVIVAFSFTKKYNVDKLL